MMTLPAKAFSMAVYRKGRKKLKRATPYPNELLPKLA